MKNQLEKLKRVEESKDTKRIRISNLNSKNKIVDSNGVQETNKKINETREDVIYLYNEEKKGVLSKNTKEQVALKLQDLNNETLKSENINYHKDLALKAKERIQYFKNQIGPLGFALLGYPTFFEIAKFLGEQGVNGQESLLEKIQLNSFSNERLASITDFELITLEDGQPGYVVKVDKSKWTGVVWGPGVAFPEMKIVFVADGLSERSTKLIKDHEIYHLNNPKASELKTLIEANLKKDFIGSVALVIQSCVNMPRWLVNVAKEVKKEKK